MKRTIVVGDIHGCMTTFAEFLQYDMHICEKHKLVLLGDYVDRGPDSAQVIENIITMQDQLEVVPLKGNHEDLFLKFLEDPMDYERVYVFIMNGGDRTLESYDNEQDFFEAEGVEMVDVTYRMGPGTGELVPTKTVRIPKHHIDWLKKLKPTHEDEKFIYVHAGLRPHVALGDQTEDDLLWIRQEFMYAMHDFGKIVVHGHTPVRHKEDILHPTRINLDLGLGKNGNFAGMEIFEDGTYTIRTRQHAENDVYGTAYAYQPETKGYGGW